MYVSFHLVRKTVIKAVNVKPFTFIYVRYIVCAYEGNGQQI